MKLPLYANAGIPEVWIVDIKGEEVERDTEPTEAGYRRIEKKRRGEKVESAIVAGISVPVDTTLG